LEKRQLMINLVNDETVAKRERGGEKMGTKKGAGGGKGTGSFRGGPVGEWGRYKQQKAR